MKDETLEKFRTDFTDYLGAIQTGFSEIDKLEAEVAEIEAKIADEIGSRKIRIEKLKTMKANYEDDKFNHGYWPYTDEDYAFMRTKPTIEEEDTAGILMRLGSAFEVPEILKKRINMSGTVYAYMDIESYKISYIKVEDAPEFEKNHLIINLPYENNDERVRQEFFLGCVTMTPEESAKQLVLKYTNEAQQLEMKYGKKED